MVNRAGLIPGASSGIGFELAYCLACEYYRLALCKNPISALEMGFLFFWNEAGK